tara:strand:+ start:1604 stop:2002 length:399 start_codon:yes stop_codon:yes gene_type:complete
MTVAITQLRATIAAALENEGVWSTFDFPPPNILANSVVVVPGDEYLVPANGHYNQIAIAPLANFKILMTVPLFDNQGNLQGIEETMVAVFNKLANSSIVFNVTSFAAPTVLSAASGELLSSTLNISVLTRWE